MSCLWQLTGSVSWQIIYLLLCVMVDIISAVQFNVPLAPLPKNVLKKVKIISFLYRSTSKELFFLWATRWYWWYLPSKTVSLNVLFVCLLTLCGVSIYCLLVIMACFHHTFLLSSIGNKTLVQCCHKKDNSRFICF